MSNDSKWMAMLFAVLTALYILPSTGIFNGMAVLGIPFNVVYLTVILFAFTFLAVAWYISPSRKKDVSSLNEEVKK